MFTNFIANIYSYKRQWSLRFFPVFFTPCNRSITTIHPEILHLLARNRNHQGTKATKHDTITTMPPTPPQLQLPPRVEVICCLITAVSPGVLGGSILSNLNHSNRSCCRPSFVDFYAQSSCLTLSRERNSMDLAIARMEAEKRAEIAKIQANTRVREALGLGARVPYPEVEKR